MTHFATATVSLLLSSRKASVKSKRIRKTVPVPSSTHLSSALMATSIRTPAWQDVKDKAFADKCKQSSIPMSAFAPENLRQLGVTLALSTTSVKQTALEPIGAGHSSEEQAQTASARTSMSQSSAGTVKSTTTSVWPGATVSADVKKLDRLASATREPGLSSQS